MNNSRLIVSHSPHTKSAETTKSVMLDVLIALLPALIAGVIVMGYRASCMAAVCVAASMFFEWGWQKLLKKPSSIGDYSAAVTGLLIALNIPVTLPFWMAAVGCFFAIIIVKQFFGGLGNNFMNPALAARAFLLTSWAKPMTTWIKPFEKISLFGNADVISSATPLGMLKEGGDSLPGYADLFFGNISGSIGEVSALAIIIGGIYLIYKGVIDGKITFAYLFTLFILSYTVGKDGLYQILSGGVMLGAFFMATDYVTTPYTKAGQIIFGVGCGFITFIIRNFGGYPEGVTYAVLLMNLLTPLIDRITVPKSFGELGERANAK